MASVTNYRRNQINNLRAPELRAALLQRGLDTDGTVPTLKERLKVAILPVNQGSQGSQATIPSQSTSASPDDNEWDQDISFRKQGPVYKRIPKGSRLQCNKSFRVLLDNVTKNNDKDSWEKLLNFARCGIGSSKRGGKKAKSQATVINKRLTVGL